MRTTRNKVFIAFYITLVTVVVLAMVSYAWMSIAFSPAVGNMSLFVTMDNALEIAPDEGGTPGKWSNVLDLSGTFAEGVLKPMTFFAKDLTFYAPLVMPDGRIKTLRDEPAIDIVKISRDSSVAAGDGEVVENILVYKFYLRTESTNALISLIQKPIVQSDDVESDSEKESGDPEETESPEEEEYAGSGSYLIGQPVWNPETLTHELKGNLSEYAMRIGLFIDATPVAPGQPAPDEPVFIMYEPNADSSGAVTETYSLDGESDTLNGKWKLIRQTKTVVSEQDPPLEDSVNVEPGRFLQEDNDLCTLIHDTERHVTMFIWLEGQDKDCLNYVHGGITIANLQFTGDVSPYNPITPDNGED